MYSLLFLLLFFYTRPELLQWPQLRQLNRTPNAPPCPTNNNDKTQTPQNRTQTITISIVLWLCLRAIFQLINWFIACYHVYRSRKLQKKYTIIHQRFYCFNLVFTILKVTSFKLSLVTPLQSVTLSLEIQNINAMAQ